MVSSVVYNIRSRRRAALLLHHVVIILPQGASGAGGTVEEKGGYKRCDGYPMKGNNVNTGKKMYHVYDTLLAAANACDEMDACAALSSSNNETHKYLMKTLAAVPSHDCSDIITDGTDFWTTWIKPPKKHAHRKKKPSRHIPEAKEGTRGRGIGHLFKTNPSQSVSE